MEMQAKTIKLVANPVGQMVKIRAVRDVSVDGMIHLAGKELDVSEEIANDLCVEIDGPYAFSGTRSNYDAPKSRIVRAVRL